MLELRQRAADNYFHWHVDALANLWLARAAAAIDVGDRPPRLLVPIGSRTWQRESLALAGIEDGRIIPVGSVASLGAPEFLVPVRSFGSRDVPPWTVRALREVAGGVGPTLASDEGAREARPRLLHVRREGTARRRVVGEDDLADGLEELGFAAFEPSTASVAEQRRSFAAADVIVAAHGAALTNLAWARPGALVVELLSLTRPNLAFHRIASQAGLRYVGVLCAAAGPANDPHADILADRELILRTLEESMP